MYPTAPPLQTLREILRMLNSVLAVGWDGEAAELEVNLFGKKFILENAYYVSPASAVLRNVYLSDSGRVAGFALGGYGAVFIDLESGKRVEFVPPDASKDVWSVAVSPDDSTYLAINKYTGTDDTAHHAYALDTEGNVLWDYSGSVEIFGIRWTEHGILTAASGTATLRNPDQSLSAVWQVTGLNVSDAVFVSKPYGDYIALPDKGNGRVAVIDLTEGSITASLSEANMEAISADVTGNYLFAGFSGSPHKVNAYDLSALPNTPSSVASAQLPTDWNFSAPWVAASNGTGIVSAYTRVNDPSVVGGVSVNGETASVDFSVGGLTAVPFKAVANEERLVVPIGKPRTLWAAVFKATV